MIDNDLLLFIEPQLPPSKLPIIDEITLKMVSKFRQNAVRGAEVRKDDKRLYRDPPYMFLEMTWNDKYNFIINNGFMGLHGCSCGVASQSQNFLLQTGDVVNSLCIHYLAFHRDEVPPEQLDKISSWKIYGDEIVPTDEELAWSSRIEDKSL